MTYGTSKETLDIKDNRMTKRGADLQEECEIFLIFSLDSKLHAENGISSVYSLILHSEGANGFSALIPQTLNGLCWANC